MFTFSLSHLHFSTISWRRSQAPVFSAEFSFWFYFLSVTRDMCENQAKTINDDKENSLTKTIFLSRLTISRLRAEINDGKMYRAHLFIEIIEIIKQLVVKSHIFLHIGDVGSQLIDFLLHAVHTVEDPDLSYDFILGWTRNNSHDAQERTKIN